MDEHSSAAPTATSVSLRRSICESLLAGRPLSKEEDRSKRVFTLEEIQAALAQNQAERRALEQQP
jgi:hypothetical protein